MFASRSHRSAGNPLPGSILVFISLAGTVCGLTLLFLGMRGVMEIGGSCGSGGPYVYRQACPTGVPLALIGGIWGGVIMCGLYAWQTLTRGIPSLIGLAWSALFLSLGWNFAEFGVHPPGGAGLEWGWLVCALVFGVMGAVPLLVTAGPVLRGFLPFGHNAGPSVASSDRQRSSRPPSRLADETTRQEEARHLVNLLSQAGSHADMSVARQTQHTPPVGPENEGGMVSALELLAALRRSGSLTEEEFVAAKRRVLEDDQ